MKITYKLEPTEYVSASHFHHNDIKRHILLTLYIGITIMVVALSTDFSNMHKVLNNTFIAFFSVAFYILFVKMTTTQMSLRRYKKSKKIQEEVTLHISGKGIRASVNEKSIPWSSFNKYKINEDFYLIYSINGNYNVIPRRVLSQQDTEDLNTYLIKYLGD